MCPHLASGVPPWGPCGSFALFLGQQVGPGTSSLMELFSDSASPSQSSLPPCTVVGYSEGKQVEGWAGLITLLHTWVPPSWKQEEHFGHWWGKGAE